MGLFTEPTHTNKHTHTRKGRKAAHLPAAVLAEVEFPQPMLQTLSKSIKEMERGEIDSAEGNEKGRRDRDYLN